MKYQMSFRTRKNGKKYPITPRVAFVPHGKSGNYISLDNQTDAQQKTAHFLKIFNDPTTSHDDKLKIKRALVSASNKAKRLGNDAVAAEYKQAYQQMNITSKNSLATYAVTWESTFGTKHTTMIEGIDEAEAIANSKHFPSHAKTLKAKEVPRSREMNANNDNERTVFRNRKTGDKYILEKGNIVYLDDDGRPVYSRKNHGRIKRKFTRDISYASKADAELELAKQKEEWRGTPNEYRIKNLRIRKFKGGEGLDKHRSDPTHKYIPVKERYTVGELN